MKNLLIVVDPIPSGHSAQYELFSSMAGYLSKDYDVSIASIFISVDKQDKFSRLGVKSISLSKKPPHLCRVLSMMDRSNESMLWLESWLRESLFRRNSEEFEKLSKEVAFDYVINATNTVPINADIWWAQGPPLLTTLLEMADDNVVAKAATVLGNPLISSFDYRLRNEIAQRSMKVIANSRYSSELYASMGIKIDGVVFNTKDFSNFRPCTSSPSRDFVLTYIGKETDIKPILNVAAQGVRVIGFGSKLPLGIRKGIVSTMIDFRGNVSDSDLKYLYSNALFTLFPFTNEPFGYIPLESMACGTPVLTYGKQGPAETVLDGITGWLVGSQQEIVTQALAIWKAGRTNIEVDSCIDRVAAFSPGNTTRQFVNLLNGDRYIGLD